MSSVAIGGLGAIGLEVAKALDAGIDGLELCAVSVRDRDAARANLSGFRRMPDLVGVAELAGADIVVECLPAAIFREVAEPALTAGRTLLPLSVGQLLVHDDLLDIAQKHGARIVVPTGALLGLDAVRAAAEGNITSVRMVTRKPPGGLEGAPYLRTRGMSLAALDEAKCIFSGSAREGARGFPANVNVAAALSLAGIGPDRTRLEIWADPDIERNTHKIFVQADSADFEMRIENVPSSTNPKTGLITGLSTIAALRGLVATLKVGS